MEKSNLKKNNKVKNKKTDQNKVTKPFDKKKYRDKKYNNKYIVKKWEEKRKLAAIRHLKKELKKEQSKKFYLNKSNGSLNKNDTEPASPVLSAKKEAFKNNRSPYQEKTDESNKKWLKGPFISARKEAYKKEQEKKHKNEQYLKAKAEREEALRKYKEKKMRTYKKLSMKTKKGQPAMAGRLELLLEKIQQSS